MLNPQEEARFAKLRDDCRALGVPSPPEIHIRFQVHDRAGKLALDDIQRGHSWTRNFYNFMFMTLADVGGSGSDNFAAGYLSGKSVSGTNRYSATYCAQRNAQILGAGFHNNAVNSSFGVVVGTGNTAFSAEHLTLATQIAHGNSATQLYHQAMAAPVQAYTAGTKTWKNTLSRIYNNNSGGSITVAEVGLYWYGAIAVDGSTLSYNMLERSVLSPTVPVADGAQLTVTYEISMDFSAID